MAANRTAQQKRRSGWLKGGAAAVESADVASLAMPDPDGPTMPGASSCEAAGSSPRYALSLGSGLKIRLTMQRKAVASDGSEEVESAETSCTTSITATAVAAESSAVVAGTSLIFESDGEELLEEEGDSDYDHLDDVTTVSTWQPQQQQQQSPPSLPSPTRRNTVEIVYRLDQETPLSVLVGSADLADDSAMAKLVKRLTPIATVPLESATVAATAELHLLTIRGLGLADLVERLHQRRIGLLAEAGYGESDGELGQAAMLDSPSPLLLLPAARLPWATLSVHHLPAAAPQTAAPTSPPDWWRASDGPESDVNLNSLWRSAMFKQQFCN